MGKMIFLKLDQAKWIGHVESTPIYEYSGKYYVGFQFLRLGNEDTVYCEECNSLAEAETVCAKIHDWGDESDPVRETMVNAGDRF